METKSPEQCPNCHSTKVDSHLQWHLWNYSWWNIIEACLWIVLIPLGFWMLLKRYGEQPDESERICLDCKHTWDLEGDEDEEE